MASIDEADDYNSASDSDFGGSLSASSASDSEGGTTKAQKRKAEGIEDSGDEKIVKEGGRKRRKKGKGKGNGEVGDGGEGDGGEGEGVGMRVRTRSGRGRTETNKALPTAEATTVNVDDLWAKLNSTPKPSNATLPPSTTLKPSNPSDNVPNPPDTVAPSSTHAPSTHAPSTFPTPSDPLPAVPHSSAEETITITRTYTFAGTTTTETKTVPKSSAEARLHLSQQPQPPNSPESQTQTKPPLRRPKKRISRFEPSSSGTGGGEAKGPKLNTIEKSKMDWAGYVDSEGMKEELDVAGKAKEGYLGKMDFLGRVEGKREGVEKRKS